MKTQRQREQELAVWFMEESGNKWETASEECRNTCTTLAKKLIKAGYANVAEYEAEIDRLVNIISKLNTKIDEQCVKKTDNAAKSIDDKEDVLLYSMLSLLTLGGLMSNAFDGLLNNHEDKDNE